MPPKEELFRIIKWRPLFECSLSSWKFVKQNYWVSNCSVPFLSICSYFQKSHFVIQSVSFCSVWFLFVSYKFKYKLFAIHSVPFRSVSFPRSQSVCSSSTRCLYLCLLFRVTVNYAELGINVHTSPKNIRSQNITPSQYE